MVNNPLTKNIDMSRPPPDINAYEAADGYQSLRNIAAGLSADDVLDKVKESGLKGRGGAGFPTGLKWSFVPRGDDSPRQKYLVVNADEMEPGTFKDRLLMEGDPHLLIEGMIIGAYAIGASVAYIFLRGEYVAAEKRCARPSPKPRTRVIWAAIFSIPGLTWKSSCTPAPAAISAVRKLRCSTRWKASAPTRVPSRHFQVSGLWGKLTIVNNVETLCNLPGILGYGVDWYHSLTRGIDHGTKLFGVSGKVNSPGCWELPLGTPIRELLEDKAGGMRDGLQLKGFLPGGGSTDFMLPEHLDLNLDYEDIGKAGEVAWPPAP